MFKRIFLFLRNFFFNPPDGLRDHDLALVIDADQMIKRLKLEKLARDAAKHELPATQADQPDGTERRIHALMQKRMAEWTHAVNQRLIQYNTALSDSDLENAQQRIRNLAENAKLRLNSRLAEAEQQLGIMKDELTRNTAYYRAFQQKNRLEADAEYPESRLYHYSLVILILVVEALANGYFFARGSEFGMLGGISQSLIVAALNILPAFLFAGVFCLRYCNHVAFLKKTAAAFGLLLYTAAMLAFNLCVAHYREIVSPLGEPAITQVTERLFASPFGLSDLNSWLLLFMGIFFAFVAMIDGYKSDDPYPGYGKIQRLNDEIRESYDMECRELAEDANRIRGEFLEELHSLKATAKSAFTHLCHLAESKPALITRHKHGLETLARTADALIHHYRSINASYRKTPAPAYFNQCWKLEYDFELIGAKDEHKRIERQKKLYESLPAFLQKATNEIEAIYTAFFDRLQRIEPAIQPALVVETRAA